MGKGGEEEATRRVTAAVNRADDLLRAARAVALGHRITPFLVSVPEFAHASFVAGATRRSAA